jgi:hypothetical protein
MVASNNSSSLEQRMRRLELLFIETILSLAQDDRDEDLLFEIRRYFREPQNDKAFTSRDLEHLASRLLDPSRSAQGKSLKRRTYEVQEEVRAIRSSLDQLQAEFDQQVSQTQEGFHVSDLKIHNVEIHNVEEIYQIKQNITLIGSKLDELQIDTHSLLVIQSLGLDIKKSKSRRFIPVRVYIDETPEGSVHAISTAIGEVLSAYEFEIADEFPAVRGSWFKKWIAKTTNAISQPEVIDRLEKIERAVELKSIDKPQSEVDEKQAKAISTLIKSLEKVPNAAVQAGSVLVVKLTTPKGPIIQARTLSQEELMQLEDNQLLLQDPSEVLERLSAACSKQKRPLLIQPSS